ncbi:unnamed protein product [Closterium sp. Naga37s-1]|nr:unnamed protein product [Closterium sp. Naga37s-1]
MEKKERNLVPAVGKKQLDSRIVAGFTGEEERRDVLSRRADIESSHHLRSAQGPHSPNSHVPASTALSSPSGATPLALLLSPHSPHSHVPGRLSLHLLAQLVLIALTAMFLDGSLFTFWRNWHPLDSLEAAAVPGLLYAAQNTLIQVALRHLDYLTFNLLNQTKLLFTALSNYLFLGIRQTRVQIVALCMLLVAATLLTLSPGPSSSPGCGVGESGAGRGAGAGGISDVWAGIDPQPVASAASPAPKALLHASFPCLVKRRSPHLFTIEMCSLTSLVLLVSLFTSQDGARMLQLGFFHAWTPLTIIPALSNAIGGILVGLVTKYAGGVKKDTSYKAIEPAHPDGLLVTTIVQCALVCTPLALCIRMVFLPPHAAVLLSTHTPSLAGFHSDSGSAGDRHSAICSQRHASLPLRVVGSPSPFCSFQIISYFLPSPAYTLPLQGFTVIAGLLVTAIVQYALDGTPPSLYVWMALPLTVLSTYLYSSSAAPPAVPAAKSKEL